MGLVGGANAVGSDYSKSDFELKCSQEIEGLLVISVTTQVFSCNPVGLRKQILQLSQPSLGVGFAELELGLIDDFSAKCDSPRGYRRVFHTGLNLPGEAWTIVLRLGHIKKKYSVVFGEPLANWETCSVFELSNY